MTKWIIAVVVGFILGRFIYSLVQDRRRSNWMQRLHDMLKDDDD